MAAVNGANNYPFAKTARGKEEIATRKYGLASKLRWMLVLVDGKTNKDDLLNKASILGLDENSLIELVNSDFIVQVDSADATGQQLSPVPEKPTGKDAVVIPISEAKPAAKENATPSAKESTSVVERGSVEQILALKTFFNETIKNTLGLRGFSMQLRVERAATLQDFIDLRQPYLEAVYKARGKEMASSLRDRLDQHLGLFQRASRPGDGL